MIHYHGTDLNGSDQPVLALQARHVMVSYARPAQLPECAELAQSFSLDNGAFSAWSNQEHYDFEGYYEWIETWRRHPGFDWCLIPDKIDGDHIANEILVRDWPSEFAGFGVPVWHLHEPIEYLEMLAAAFPRIALGSSGEYRQPGTKKWWSRMATAMSAICDEQGRPICKLHGLRMLDPTIFSHFPFASADSTNVGRNLGMDGRWTGAYAPKSKRMRALLLIERIEAHASAAKWSGSGVGAMPNHDLFG